jgi:hypothetical protein
MNIRKNFEAFFLVAAAFGLLGSYATAGVRPVEIAAHAPSAIVTDGNMHVVVVKAQRLSAAGKAALN